MEEEETAEDGMTTLETYSIYAPEKLKIGMKHPDTTSLASVESANVEYKLKLPEVSIDKCLLSKVQLEAVIYACQAHEHTLADGSKMGFFLGDGTGVGKGRTIAGIIYENYLQNRQKAVWVSSSNDLKYDVERDFTDIEAQQIAVYALNTMQYNSRIEGVCSGVLFCTYASLIGKSRRPGKCNTRLAQIVDWCGSDFNGCIVFDECHKAKNLVMQTKTGKAVFDLQCLFPYARVIYASATGASEPQNMAYMVRLGLWGIGTSFQNFEAFATAIERRSISAMEIVAMQMKLKGIYVARQLSFTGVSFRIEKVDSSNDFIQMYNESVNLWNYALKSFHKAAAIMKIEPDLLSKIMGQFWGAHQRFFSYLIVASKVNHVVTATKEAIQSGKCVVIGLQSTGEARSIEKMHKNNGILNGYVSTAKEVFKTLVETQYPALKQSEKQSSGKTSMNHGYNLRCRRDANMIDSHGSLAASDSEDDFNLDSATSSSDSEDDSNSDSATSEKSQNGKGNLTSQKRHVHQSTSKIQHFISKQYEDSAANTNIELTGKMKNDLLQKIDGMEVELPANTLDALIHKLGGSGQVAEMTGRKGRIITLIDGSVHYETRTEIGISAGMINIKEKERFMDGTKLIAIISEAASNGISLQSDRRVANCRQRLHITLELPWSAERAIQQFGRTHRSNQCNSPEYLFVLSELAGEQRFLATVAKRLESLSALTRGDRRAVQALDLTAFNIDTQYGRRALGLTLEAIARTGTATVPPPEDYKGDFFADAQNALLDVNFDTSTNVLHFLNRSLGIRVDLQNHILKYFAETLHVTILKAKKLAVFDESLLDIGQPEHIQRISVQSFFSRVINGPPLAELHTVRVNRGCTWGEAVQKYKTLNQKNEDFYIYREPTMLQTKVMLASRFSVDDNMTPENMLFTITRPNTGVSRNTKSLCQILLLYQKVTMSQAQKYWTHHYNTSSIRCNHVFFSGKCATKIFPDCDAGKRVVVRSLLSGSLLRSVWQQVEKQLSNGENGSGLFRKLQICRLQTNDGESNKRRRVK